MLPGLSAIGRPRGLWRIRTAKLQNIFYRGIIITDFFSIGMPIRLKSVVGSLFYDLSVSGLAYVFFFDGAEGRLHYVEAGGEAFAPVLARDG